MFEVVVSELVGLTDSELHERIGSLELQRRRTEAELAAAIAVADNRALYQDDAHRSMKGYLKATCNYSNHETARWRSAAATVNEYPAIGDAWMRGRIGSPQVNALARTHGNRRVRDAMPSFVPLLVANAEEMNFEDFTETVDHFVEQADADGSHDERDDAIEHRRAGVRKVGHALDITAFGGVGVTTDEVIQIFESFCEAEFQKDLHTRRDLHGDDASQHDLPRSATQRSYDAMVAIFRTANAGVAIGVNGTAADTVVNIVIDAASFSRIMGSAGLAPTSVDGFGVDPFTGLPAANSLLGDLMIDPHGLNGIKCETDSGVAVHPHDVLRATLAGHVRRVVLDSAGHVIDFGRRKRLFDGPSREAAKLLVRNCEHPGCDLPKGWSNVDHNTEWNEFGETNQDNAGVLCGTHNRAKHHLGLRRRRGVNGIGYTTRADGTIILPVGARTPQFDPDDPDDRPDTPDEIKRMTHLARERLRALHPENVA